MFPKQLSSYYRKRTALPAPSCCEVLAAEVLGGRCTLQAHFRCTPPVSGSILIWKNVPPGIIFPRRKHPCSKKFLFKDYFPEAKASLLREFPFQGLFSQGKSIPARRNPPPGIIFSRRMHPCSRKSPVRDYFPKAKASLLREIPRQGLFSRGWLFARNHIQTSAEPGEHKLMSTNHTLSAGGQPHSRLPQRLKQVLSFLPALLIMVAIFRFSSQNADDSSTESIRITQELLCAIRDRFRLSWIPSQLSLYIERSEFFIRKLAHFSEYAALGLSLILPLCAFYSGSFKKKTLFLTSWIICIAYAASDELHQFFSPGRSPQIRDVVIDSFGALAGILLGLLLIRIRRSLRNCK